VPRYDFRGEKIELGFAYISQSREKRGREERRRKRGWGRPAADLLHLGF
jgi:hypothetical protein